MSSLAVRDMRLSPAHIAVMYRKLFQSGQEMMNGTETGTSHCAHARIETIAFAANAGNDCTVLQAARRHSDVLLVAVDSGIARQARA